jgi:hypothetical protein
MSNPDHDPKQDRNPDHDPVGKAVAPAPAAGALASLAALETAFANVDMASLSSRSGLPFLQFKSRENEWMYGQKRTVPEKGGHWAINPCTFEWGWICFGSDKTQKPLGDVHVSISKPKPDFTKLPATGFRWQEQRLVNMKCLDRADAGVEVTFTIATDGGVKAVDGLIMAVRDRLMGDRHGGKVVPIVELSSDSYQHREHGRIWFPTTPILDWMSLDGPAPASASPSPLQPAPTTPTDEQPRRRRVA